MLTEKCEIDGLNYISKGSYAKVFGDHNVAAKIYTDYESNCIFSVLREGLLLGSGRVGPSFKGVLADKDKRFKGLLMQRASHTMANLRYDRGDTSTILLNYRDVLGDLCFLHSKGLIHGDIKPANILVMPDGRATLCDFGLMCWATGYGPGSCLQEELYTPMFRSPELFDSVPPYEVSLSDDIWAFGISMYTAFINTVNRHKREEVEALHMSILRYDFEERRALFLNRILGLDNAPIIAEVLARALDPVSQKRASAAQLYALMTTVKRRSTIEYLGDLPSKRESMQTYSWLVPSDVEIIDVSRSSLTICDTIARSVWSIVHIFDNEDLFKSCRELFQLLMQEKLSLTKAAVISAVLCGCLVRRSSRFQSTWCSKSAGCSIAEYDFSLGQALSIAILRPQWASHCLKFDIS